MPKLFRQVQKGEFDAFVGAYPVRLEWDVAGMCEPPIGTYNDFQLGAWPESVVAKVRLMDGSDYYSGKTSEYFIIDSGAPSHD